VVECQLPKLDVAGSNPVSRSIANRKNVSYGNQKQPQKLCTLLHYIKHSHDAFRFGIRTTFRPSTESSSFFAATAF
jgi:hypothetical protein